MEEFPYYQLSWFFYLVFAALFLLASGWKTRSWSLWLRVPLLCFIAAMALTPGVTVSGESWWSPAAIIMVFDIDQKNMPGFWRNFISIIAVWILMIIATLTTRWVLKKKRQSPE